MPTKETDLKLKAKIVDENGIRRMLTRVAHEIVERNKGTQDLVIVGIRRRGVPLAQRIRAMIEEFEEAREHYRKLGIADRIDIDLHEGGHEIRMEKSLDFLRKWLKP